MSDVASKKENTSDFIDTEAKRIDQEQIISTKNENLGFIAVVNHKQ